MRAPAFKRLRALAGEARREEGGYSLIELVVVMAILGTVMAAIAALFTSGIRSQTDLDARFQAQVQLNTAVVKLRREAHNACGLRSGWTTSSITLNMPAANPPPQPPDTPCTVPTTITWCTIGSGSRYALYRVAGTTCTATNAKLYADYITSAAVFPSYSPTNVANSTLARLHVRFPIKVKVSTVASPYMLDDDIIMRNSSLL
jgi:prepilin-type N-terminal cleavage/methylation domain-containing protein